MFKGKPQVGDIFYDVEGDTLLIVEINEKAEDSDQQVMMLKLDSDTERDYYYDSLDNFNCGVYLAKLG